MTNIDQINNGAAILDAQIAKNLILLDSDVELYMQERGNSAHSNVKHASAFTNDLVDYFRADTPVQGASLPWAKTHDLFRLRPSEVTIWAGYNGHGKSLVLGQIMLNAMQSANVCIASFEMSPISTLARMCRQSLGSNAPTEDYVRRFCDRGVNRLWLYDQYGTVNYERIISAIYYAAEQLGAEHFVIDSLMKCGIADDDYNAQKRFIDRLCGVAKETECHIHLVAHSRKGADELAPPNKMDIKGSGSITDQVDNVMTVWRNKRKEQQISAGKSSVELQSEYDAFIICDKQRHGEWEGKIGLYFDKSGLRFNESSNQNYPNFSSLRADMQS